MIIIRGKRLNKQELQKLQGEYYTVALHVHPSSAIPSKQNHKPGLGGVSLCSLIYSHSSLYCLKRNKLSGLCPSSNTMSPYLIKTIIIIHY